MSSRRRRMIRVEVHEAVQRKGDIPWTMVLNKEDGECVVCIKGGYGGIKAAFRVRFDLLKEAILKLEGGGQSH